MKIAEDSIYRISLGMLIAIGSGLVAFTVYLASIGTRVEALEKDQAPIEQIQIDIAVMKEKLISIDKKMDGN